LLENSALLQSKSIINLKILLLGMGVNFVCRIITLEDILRCSFGLNKTEIAIMKFLLERKEELTIEEIMKKIKRDRTTIQRAVKRLFEKELIKRRQINLDKGGYVFVYAPKAKSELKEKVYKIFESFKVAVGKEIQKW
jgi:predicted transcriptional regulator